MPYLLDENQDEENQQEQPGGQVIASGPSGLVTGGVQQQAGAAAGPGNKPTRSGSWSNLVSYIDANKGNDADLGQKVKGVVDTQAQQADEAKNQFQQSATKAVNEGAQRGPETVNQIKNGSISQFSQPDQQQKLNVAYKGPDAAENINEYAAAYQQANKVQDTAKLASGNQNDRVQLVDQAFARPTYSSGEKQLDSFILGGGEQGQQALKGITDQYGQYGDKFKGLVGSLNQDVAKAKFDTAQNQEAIRAAAQQKAAEYKQQLAQKAAAENARIAAEEDRKQFQTGQTGVARQYIDQQAQSAYQDLLNRYNISNMGMDRINGGDLGTRVALERLQPNAMGWNVSKGESDAGVTGTENENTAKQYYKGLSAADESQLAAPDEVSGYNNLLDWLGGGEKLSTKAASQRSFDKEGYQADMLGRAQRYLSNLSAEEQRKLGVLK